MVGKPFMQRVGEGRARRLGLRRFVLCQPYVQGRNLAYLLALAETSVSLPPRLASSSARQPLPLQSSARQPLPCRLSEASVSAFSSFVGALPLLCAVGVGLCPVVSEGRCKDTAFLPRFQIPPSDLGRFSAPIRAIFSSRRNTRWKASM